MEAMSLFNMGTFDLTFAPLTEAPRRQRPSKPSYQRYPKPPYTYTGLIITAIYQSPEQRLTLAEIHDSLGRMFQFFRDPKYTGWKDSVRHNLSHHTCFKMILKDPLRKNGKGNYWTVDLSQVTSDVFKRQQTSVARSGTFAQDLHQQLGCPSVPLPTTAKSEITTVKKEFPYSDEATLPRKRKYDDVMADTLPAPAKRHQPFSIANILRVPKSEKLINCITDSSPTTPSAWTKQPSTPQFTDSTCKAVSSDDSGCYGSGSSAATSPAEVTSTIPHDIVWPSFDGLPSMNIVSDLSAVSDATEPTIEGHLESFVPLTDLPSCAVPRLDSVCWEPTPTNATQPYYPRYLTDTSDGYWSSYPYFFSQAFFPSDTTYEFGNKEFHFQA